MSKSEVSKLLAFSMYLDMGDARSLKGLERLIREQGHAIARSTLMRWREDGEWDKKIPEVKAAQQLEAEAAKTAIAARDMLETAVEIASAGESAKAAVDLDGTPLAPVQATSMRDYVPFTMHQKLESTAESLFAMVSALAQTVTAHVSKIRNPDDVTLDVPEMLQIVKATGEISRAAADVHKAMNPPALKGAKLELEAPVTVIGAALPADQYVHDDADDLIESLMNPPRLKTA